MSNPAPTSPPPYLPRTLIEEAQIPKSWDKDFRFQIKKIEEQYRRQFPEANYFPLNKSITSTSDPNVLVGAAGTTKFDRLYGDSMDPTQSNWSQPHLSEVANPGSPVQAADVEVFFPVVKLPRRVQLTARDDELKLYGFDRVRHALVFIPCSFFDAYGFRAQRGDKLQWDNQDFVVQQDSPAGRWKSTNLFFYRVLNVDHYRHGS